MLRRKISNLFSRNVFKINDKYSKPPSKIFSWSLIIATIVLVIFGFSFLNGNWQEFFSSFGQLGETIKEMISWDFKEFLKPNSFGVSFLSKALTSLKTTIIVSFSGTIIGVGIAIPVALLSSHNIVHNKVVNNFFKTILAILRTIPAFTFALILIGYFGQSTLSVTIAVALFTFAITGKLFLERIEHVNFKIYASIQATGANKFAAFRTAIIPQISHNILSITFYSLETNIRYIAIIGGMSSIGLGELIQNNINLQFWDRAGFLLFLLIMVVLILELLIYVIKKWILNDKDFILNKKEQETVLLKVKKSLRKNNFHFYINQVLKKQFIFKGKSWKEKWATLKSRCTAIKNFKSEHRQKIKSDFLEFKKLQASNVNPKSWFTYNQAISSNVRRDKIYLTDFNIKVEKIKSEQYLNAKKTMEEKREKFLSTLTVEQVYKSAPYKWIKRAVFYLIISSFFIYSMCITEYKLESSAVIQSTNKNIAAIFNIKWETLFVKGGMAPYSVIYLLFETLSIAIVGTFLGAIIAFVLGLLSAETIVNFYVAKVFLIITSILRAIPTYIYAIIFVSLVGLGPFNGAIALTMGTTGMLTKYFRELFEDVNMKVATQLQATGLNTWQKFRFGIMSQTTSGVISYIIYRFDINFKEVSSLGIVGAGNMGYLLNTYFGDHYFGEFGALLLGIVLFTLLVESISTTIRNKINLGINPKFMDQLIIYIKNHLWITFKSNEQTLTNQTSLSYDQARALYAYTNKQLVITSKTIQKEQKVSYKIAWVQAYNNYFQTDFSNMMEIKNFEATQLKQFKIARKDFIITIKQTYHDDLAILKHNFHEKVLKTSSKAEQKAFRQEYKKTKQNYKKILNYKRSSLS